MALFPSGALEDPLLREEEEEEDVEEDDDDDESLSVCAKPEAWSSTVRGVWACAASKEPYRDLKFINNTVSDRVVR